MEDPNPSAPDFQNLSPPQMPYPTQQPPPSYAQYAAVPAYPQSYNYQPQYLNQFAPVPHQSMVYQPAQHVVTVSGAPLVVGAALQPRYSDYMCWSIMNLLFCCQPLGLVALIFSCKAQSAIYRQDLYSARSYSSTARGLNVAAMMFGVFFYISFTMFMVMRRS